MVEVPPCRLHHRDERGRRLPFLVWRFPAPWRAVSTAAVGGGLGDRSWIVNAQVAPDYDRRDLDDHVATLVRAARLDDGERADDLLELGAGVGLLTAADVGHGTDVRDGTAVVRASVGIRLPVLAGTAASPATDADRRDAVGAPAPGTINIVVLLPSPVSDAALVNVATTVTEAKVQALFDAGVAGTGTASDAVVVACPRAAPGASAPPAAFGGPLSLWGGRAARASYAAVLDGVAHSRAVMAADARRGAEPRRPGPREGGGAA